MADRRYSPQRGKNSRASQESRESQFSRTPSEDRRLLQNLTLHDNGDDVTDGGYASVQPVRQQQIRNDKGSSRHTSHSGADRNRQSTHHSEDVDSQSTRGVRVGYDGSPNTPVDERRQGRLVVQMPRSTANDAKTGDDWQAGKTVAQSNSYMLKYEVACDVTFVVGETREEVCAHKYMLMARSSVLFKSLVKHLGNMDVKIGVPDIKLTTFRDMMQYVYTDEFDIHADNVTAMLFAAKKFALRGLSDMCFQYLEAEMHPDNVARTLEQAHIYSETTLYDKCLRYIYSNGNSVFKSSSFGELCRDCLTKIIKSDDLVADEEFVYEGCISWATVECRQQNKQATDEARREILGNLLYLIRFPIMNVSYFTHKVSLSQVLSHDEKLSIFQFFHGEEQQLPNRFAKTERNRQARPVKESPDTNMFTSSRSSGLSRVSRFRTYDGQWKQHGPADAISFVVTSSIALYGVEIFGAARGAETYSLKVYVEDDRKQEVARCDTSVNTNAMRDRYDVYLPRPIRIQANRIFTIGVAIKGGPTRKGVDGEATRVVDGVTFEFIASNRSSNGTDVTVGQIPGILFNRTQ